MPWLRDGARWPCILYINVLHGQPQLIRVGHLGLCDLVGDRALTLEALLVRLESGIAARLHTSAAGISVMFKRCGRLRARVSCAARQEAVWQARTQATVPRQMIDTSEKHTGHAHAHAYACALVPRAQQTQQRQTHQLCDSGVRCALQNTLLQWGQSPAILSAADGH